MRMRIRKRRRMRKRKEKEKENEKEGRKGRERKEGKYYLKLETYFIFWNPHIKFHIFIRIRIFNIVPFLYISLYLYTMSVKIAIN